MAAVGEEGCAESQWCDLTPSLSLSYFLTLVGLEGAQGRHASQAIGMAEGRC
jgi:hypothetical protein